MIVLWRPVDGPIYRNIFKTWAETQFATLHKSEFVVLDNVAFRKSTRADELVRAKGAWLRRYNKDRLSRSGNQKIKMILSAIINVIT